MAPIIPCIRNSDTSPQDDENHRSPMTGIIAFCRMPANLSSRNRKLKIKEVNYDTAKKTGITQLVNRQVVV